ncbi:ABC transporter permease [Gemmatimonadota bacterium]
MRDWKRYVQERLALVGLKESRRSTIVEEVASQLEDLYLEARSRGLSDADAVEAIQSHVPDWRELDRAILQSGEGGKVPRLERWGSRSEEGLRRRGGRWSVLADALQDLRYALRTLRGSPVFTAVAVLTLALGVGGVTVIFTLYDQILLRPLPYQDSGELVELWEKLASFDNASVAYPNFQDWRERNRVFEDMAVWNEGSLNLTGSGDPAEVDLVRVSASAFPLLRADAALGRSFHPDEDRVGGERVVVLTHGFWSERYGEDPSVIGRTITLDETPCTVIGVMPEGFWFPPRARQVDLYAPVEQFAESWMENRGNHPGLMGLARLRTGLSLEEARQDMERVALQLEAEYPDQNEGSRVNLASFQDRVTQGTRESLHLLLLAVALLLLIACINVANLFLARATSRQHEMSIRESLGAGKRRILRLLLTESVAVWLLGGALGILVAFWGTRVLTSLLADQIPRVFEVGLDLRIVVFALGLSFITGILFGFHPALRVVRQDLREFLKEGRRASGGVGRSRFRTGLVISEVSLAVLLLVGSGLTLRSFSMVLNTSTGLDPANVLTVELNLPEGRYPDGEERTAFYFQLLERVRGLPGVRSAATTYVVPMASGGWQGSYHAEGQPPEEGAQYAFAEISAVSRDYFLTMGIPLLRGQDFTEARGSDEPPVVIVDQGMAESYWPDEDPIGKRLKFGDFSSENEWMEVVGVVGHVEVNGVMREALPQFYLPQWQDNDSGYWLVVRSQGDPYALVEPIRRAVLSLDPSQPVGTVRTMEAFVRQTTQGTEMLATLLTIFAAAALLLSGVGIYGVMSQITAERSHEMGIRVALGAQGREVLRMVFREGMVRAGLGLALGLALSVALGRIMASALFGISPLDLPTFLVAPLFVLGVAALANLLPARRAMVVDPVRAIQGE